MRSTLTAQLRRRANGNPASAIYGTIVAAAVVAAEGVAGHSTTAVVVAMFGALAVFWIAHAYTDTLGRRIEDDEPTPVHFGHVLRHEWPIVESGVPLAVVLVLGAALGATVDHAASAALVAAVLELFGWATLACRRSGMSVRRGIPYVLIAGLFGVAVVALKFAIH